MSGVPETLWQNHPLLETSCELFGLPCELDGTLGGWAEWRQGPLKHIRLCDEPRVTLTSRAKAKRTPSFANVEIAADAGGLQVHGDNLGAALAAMALALVLHHKLLTMQEILDDNVYALWTEAGQTPSGAAKLLRLIRYLSSAGEKSYAGLVEFSKTA